MAERTHCIYCNKEISKRSSEHIIQNALGGQLESTDFCCPECNTYISKAIDVPFTTIFNPIISRITDFSKTNNKKSMPGCTGKVLYNDKTYNANIKDGKVINCPELSRELHCEAHKLPLEIISYDFKLDNAAFQTGMAKIAFSYAMDRGVDFSYLESGLKVEKKDDKIQSIKYDYKMLPFCPLNPIDIAIEYNPKPMLYHNLILFSQHNELWCYIDLFNTFQYYVLLSETIPTGEKIYANYMQTIQKINHSMPDLRHLNDPKTVMIYAQQYGVKPTMNAEEFKKRVKIAIEKKSCKVPMAKIIEPRIQQMLFEDFLNLCKNPQNLLDFYRVVQLYMNNDVFQEQNFRTVTPALNGDGISSYPHEILKMVSENPDALKPYTAIKFNKLNNLLLKKER
jgi:hypothetical protein